MSTSVAVKGGSAAGAVVVVAWAVAALYYFVQYVMRSAPAVMMPQLEAALGLSAAGLTSLLGLFYFGYAPFSLVAGVAMDQLGPRLAIPFGAATMAVGALMFATGDPTMAAVGRFVQGAGGVFALIGAAYLATTYFPASRAATLVGATQMAGMAGGSAGQFLVGPAIAHGLAWTQFWLIGGLVALVVAALLWFSTPAGGPGAARQERWWAKAASATASVFANPQSILCGLVSGLLFLPTSIFDMVWGVRFLQEAHDMPYGLAVMRSASVPFGWIIGCPLLGALSDRIGRRKPFIIGGAALLLACMALILFGRPGPLPPYTLGLLAGIGSGAAMLPYIVIKEANRLEHAGTATGVINFINFSMTALLGPVFGGLLMQASGGGERELPHYQQAFAPLLWGVGLAIVLALFLRETGRAAKPIPANA
jgi:MFS family permease